MAPSLIDCLAKYGIRYDRETRLSGHPQYRRFLDAQTGEELDWLHAWQGLALLVLLSEAPGCFKPDLPKLIAEAKAHWSFICDRADQIAEAA